jgi:hypothetical protein
MPSHLGTRVAAPGFWKPGVFPLLANSGLELEMDNPHYGFASLSQLKDFLFQAKSSIL